MNLLNTSGFVVRAFSELTTLLQEVESVIKSAVASAVSAWGSKQLSALEAEDRLSIACEQAPTSDPVISSLREAFNAIFAVYKPMCDEQKQEVSVWFVSLNDRVGHISLKRTNFVYYPIIPESEYCNQKTEALPHVCWRCMSAQFSSSNSDICTIFL